jgi:hypothetical protein
MFELFEYKNELPRLESRHRLIAGSTKLRRETSARLRRGTKSIDGIFGRG